VGVTGKRFLSLLRSPARTPAKQSVARRSGGGHM
jgi:hypothetical protein